MADKSKRKNGARAAFEKIEGQFHDGLGTLAEVLVVNALISQARLDRRPESKAVALAKIAGALEKLPSGDTRRGDLKREVRNIRAAALDAAVHLLGRAPRRQLLWVCHTPGAGGGRAGDLVLTWSDRSESAVSIKTDKSGKVALAGVGQTSIENWAKTFYGVEVLALERLARRKLERSLDDAKRDYLLIGHLMQLVVMDTLGVIGASVNDWSEGRPTDLEALRRLLRQAKHHLHGPDKAELVILSRSGEGCTYGTHLDELDVNKISLASVRFTPARPRTATYSTSLGIKVNGTTVLDHQVKHGRGDRPGTAFRDMTTRAYF